jgi:hypothetical protein
MWKHTLQHLSQPLQAHVLEVTAKLHNHPAGCICRLVKLTFVTAALQHTLHAEC